MTRKHFQSYLTARKSLFRSMSLITLKSVSSTHVDFGVCQLHQFWDTTWIIYIYCTDTKKVYFNCVSIFFRLALYKFCLIFDISSVLVLFVAVFYISLLIIFNGFSAKSFIPILFTWFDIICRSRLLGEEWLCFISLHTIFVLPSSKYSLPLQFFFCVPPYTTFFFQFFTWNFIILIH